jgi:hypothetical protein
MGLSSGDNQKRVYGRVSWQVTHRMDSEGASLQPQMKQSLGEMRSRSLRQKLIFIFHLHTLPYDVHAEAS